MKKLYILIISLSILFFSCKTKKSIIDTNNVASLEEVKSFKVLDSLKMNSLKFNTLLMKFSANMKSGGNEMSTAGTMKVLKDSIIMISITPVLGIELMRMRITKSEIVILNRINKTYYLEGIENLHKLLGIDLNYNQIQSILLNQLFTFPDNLEFQTDYKFKQILNNDILYSYFSHQDKLANSKSFLHGIMINSNRNTYSSFNFSVQENLQSLEVIYRNFESLNSVYFPNLVEINLINKNVPTNFIVESLKIEVDKELNFAFSIPSKYSQKELTSF